MAAAVLYRYGSADVPLPGGAWYWRHRKCPAGEAHEAALWTCDLRRKWHQICAGFSGTVINRLKRSDLPLCGMRFTNTDA